MKLYDLLGWAGALLAITAFLLVSVEVITPKDTIYPVLNILAAIGLIVSSGKKKDYQPVFLNIVWLLIAGVGLTRTILG